MKTFCLIHVLLLCLLPLTLRAAPLPPEAEIQHKAKQFYDTRGEWAGTFVIQRFLQQRIADQTDTRFVAHLEYEWAFKQDTSRTGTDQRTFQFEFHDNQWQITQMGGNLSGQF